MVVVEHGGLKTERTLELSGEGLAKFSALPIPARSKKTLLQPYEFTVRMGKKVYFRTTYFPSSKCTLSLFSKI